MSDTDSRKRIRVFCAVELPRATRAHAFEHAARLRAAATTGVKVNWEREEKFHITLKFFGELTPATLELLSHAAQRAAARTQPFELRLQGAGVFPSPERPHVLWLGVADDAGRLLGLQSGLEDEFALAGARRDRRTFHAHVTIARLRAAGPAERALATRHLSLGFESSSFRVAEIVLMQSVLGPGGSKYTPLSRHAF